MLSTPTVLGISMAPRKSRGLFVAVMYTVMLAVTMSILTVLSWRDRTTAWVAASCAFAMVCLLVSGWLVKQTGPLDIQGGRIMGLGLAPRRRDRAQPDERELAIRNAACFEAYRMLALYSIAIYAAVSLSFDLSATAAVKVLELLTMPLLGLALTLPHAALLWREPDVPEKARV